MASCLSINIGIDMKMKFIGQNSHAVLLSFHKNTESLYGVHELPGK